MSTKKTAVITMVALMMAGSSIAGENEGRNKRGGERDGKNRKEQMQKRKQHQRKGGSVIDHLVKNKKLLEELDITDDQVEQLKDVSSDMKAETKELVAEMKELQKHKAELMMAEDLDKKAIIKTINETGKIRTKLEKQRVRALFQTNDILTDRQVQELKERMRKRMREHKRNNKRGKKGGNNGKQNKDRQGRKNRDQDRPM